MKAVPGEHEYKELLPGIKARLVHCDESLVAIETIIEPGARVPPHQHESVQVTIVLEGSLALGVEGLGERVLSKGDYLVIPRRAKHWASSGPGARVLDINAPLTKDRLEMVNKLGGCRGELS